MKGATPADAAGINVEGSNKWLILIQNTNVHRPKVDSGGNPRNQPDLTEPIRTFLISILAIEESRMQRSAEISLSVEDTNGEPLSDFQVEVRDPTSNSRVHFDFLLTLGQARASGLSPRKYEIKVFATVNGNLIQDKRVVELSQGHNELIFVLGRKDQPFYYASNETKIYFEPDNNSFLIVARGDDASSIARQTLKKRNLETNELPPFTLSGAHGGETTTATATNSSRNSNEKKAESSQQKSSDTTFAEVHIVDQSDLQKQELMSSISEDLAQHGLKVILALPIRRGSRPIQGLTNELVVRFHDSVTEDEIRDIAHRLELTILRRILYAGNAYLFSYQTYPTYNLLRVAQTLKEEYPVKYAEPNLLRQLQADAYTPNDTLWPNMTHLRLINCDDAWQGLAAISMSIKGGSSNITIAVLDVTGVTPDHPDLTAILTDGTSKLVTSFNFSTMTPQTVAQLGPSFPDHGTQCAGIATAAFDNNRGITGVAPNCHLIGAKLPSPGSDIELADSLIWAAGFPTGNPNPAFPPPPARPADVMTNSWGEDGSVLSDPLRDCLDFLTAYGRGGRGCVVVFSIGNNGYVDFTSGAYRRACAAYNRTIAVGASINSNPTSPVDSATPDPAGHTSNINVVADSRALYSPYGQALDVVAPSATSFIIVSGSPVVIDPTTSCVRVGTGSLNGCPGMPVCNDYAVNFGGTSHSAPTVAGAAALVLSVRPALSWVEVREIVRSTAARIDSGNMNPIGQWVDNDGDGVKEFSQWYGYGRIDVNAAIVAVRDRTSFTDIVVRENLSDDGTVPSTGWHAQSPDIWVRRNDDPIPILAYNVDPPHQKPRRGQNNYVFCRVKNVGGRPSNEVYVRVMITHFPGFEFRYPQEFIPTNRPGQPIPNPLLPGTYLIGEAVLDNIIPNENRIIKMTWNQSLIPPETIMVDGMSVNWHPCLLIEASPHDGPMPAGMTFDIQKDNNIAQRNIEILNPGEPTADFSVIIVGTSDSSGVAKLVIDHSNISDKKRVLIRFTDKEMMARLLEHAKKVNMSIEKYKGIEVIAVARGKQPTEVAIKLKQNQFTPLLVAVPGRTIDREKEEELRITQLRNDGTLSAGYTMIV